MLQYLFPHDQYCVIATTSTAQSEYCQIQQKSATLKGYICLYSAHKSMQFGEYVTNLQGKKRKLRESYMTFSESFKNTIHKQVNVFLRILEACQSAFAHYKAFRSFYCFWKGLISDCINLQDSAIKNGISMGTSKVLQNF